MPLLMTPANEERVLLPAVQAVWPVLVPGADLSTTATSESALGIRLAKALSLRSEDFTLFVAVVVFVLLECLR